MEGRDTDAARGTWDARRFLGEMSLARLKAAINRRNYNAARDRIPDALYYTKGDAYREPEAIYWSAVAEYKVSDDAANLLRG